MGKFRNLFKRKSPAPPSESFDPKPEETDELPFIPYRVLYSDLPFYEDVACENEVTDARILILEPLDPEDEQMEVDVLPTRKNYHPGQLVTLDLNNKRLWEESWFRNPETQQIEKAWTLHVEFIGQIINQETLENNKERLEELSQKFAQAKEAKAKATDQQQRVN